MSDIPLNDTNFKQIKTNSQGDGRGRLTIGSLAKGKNYRIGINESGQILLDPIVVIPEREKWIWQNNSVRESLKQGLEEASDGKVQDLGSFAKYADLETDN